MDTVRFLVIDRAHIDNILESAKSSLNLTEFFVSSHGIES